MISLIHPSRGRPDKSFSTILSWCTFANVRDDLEIIISLDDDDSELMNYHLVYYLLRFPYKIIENSNMSAVDAINNAAKVATGDILVVVSDDTNCFHNWDVAIFTVKNNKDWILKTQDGIQPWMITMPIMDRVYYNRFGYIYHPDYLHMFCDTELTCVADITGRKITSNLMFKHNHYSVRKEQPDEINKKADATWAQGEKLFLERYKKNFDLPPGLPIQDNGMINWLKNKVR